MILLLSETMAWHSELSEVIPGGNMSDTAIGDDNSEHREGDYKFQSRSHLLGVVPSSLLNHSRMMTRSVGRALISERQMMFGAKNERARAPSIG